MGRKSSRFQFSTPLSLSSGGSHNYNDRFDDLRRATKGGGRLVQDLKEDKDDDCCCFSADSITQLYVTSFVLFFLGVCGGITAAALGSQRCCGSAWSNEDHVSLACSAVLVVLLLESIMIK